MSRIPDDIKSKPVPPRRSSWQRIRDSLMVIVVIWLASVAWLVFQYWPVRLEPGPRTTVITGPTRPDGAIDYSGALNSEYSTGITPENNAAVLLIQAFGPGIIDPPVRAAYFQ